MTFSNFGRIMKDAWKIWNKSKARQTGAAVSYFALFSFIPIIIISLSIAGAVLDQGEIAETLARQTRVVFGHEGAHLVTSLIGETLPSLQKNIYIFGGLALLLVGAVGVVSQLRHSLDSVLGITPAIVSQPFIRSLGDRFVLFLLVLCTGFALIVSFIAQAFLRALGDIFSIYWPHILLPLEVSSLIASFIIIAGLFVLLYRFLSGERVAWRESVHGSIIATVLFLLGKSLLTAYFLYGSVFSVYGAAGAFVVLMIWTYFSIEVFLFGAAYIQARRHH